MGISLYKIKKWTKMLIGKSISHVDQGVGKIYSVDEIKNNKQYEGLVCH